MPVEQNHSCPVIDPVVNPGSSARRHQARSQADPREICAACNLGGAMEDEVDRSLFDAKRVSTNIFKVSPAQETILTRDA
jgi:hypothetical protein